ncbi:hypothetical protein SAMN05421545_3939 [Pontibacter lucknowensis]|uniref:Uncharacterized protein n=1 Tax=Pontibacter lucknowensis TaxID=1077936 RepID=A0A1N7BFM3_9BACT|nr:hypothetical protein SAMN05421545_3939 [Pontibacter lucknowensis]
MLRLRLAHLIRQTRCGISRLRNLVVLRTKAALIEGRHLPEFELNQGELMSLLVDSMEIALILKDYLIGKKQHPNVQLLKSFAFVEQLYYL